MRAIFLILLILILAACLMPRKRVKQSYATYIEHFNSANGNGIGIWQLKYNGKTYRLRAQDAQVKESKCVVYFDTLNPSTHYYIDLFRPVFVAGEETVIDTGIVTYDSNRYPRKKNILVYYEYYVNKVKYVRTRHAFDGLDTVNYRKGDKFEVEYWVEDPLRSILHLDRPIK